ncbi:DHAR2 [Symbiodinium sp. CCMP2592]|nr:DHAR2 [Symbiodinium sp. CCMP2592]
MEEILQGSAASPAGTDGASSRSKPFAASRCSLYVLAGLDKPLTWLSLELAFLQPLLPFSPGNLSNAFMIVAPAALKLALPVPVANEESWSACYRKAQHLDSKRGDSKARVVEERIKSGRWIEKLRFPGLGSSAPLAAAAAAAQALRPRPGRRRLASASQGVAVEWQTLRSRIVETPTGKELVQAQEEISSGLRCHPDAEVRFFGSSRQTPRVTFYRDSAALCPRCQAVWLLLEAKRIDYIVVKENLPSYGERSEAFLRKVPRGALPAIEIDGRWATDSLDAMFLLERTFPNPERPMIPGFSRLRGRAIELLELQRAVHSAWCNYLFRAEMSFVNEPAVDFAAALGQVQTALERDTETPWFLPYEHPTIVDIQYVCTLERIVASAFFYKAMDVRADFPGIDRWLRAFEELPWYRATRGDYYSLCMALEPAFGEPQPSPMNNSSRTDWRKLLPENYRLPFALRRDVEMTAAEAASVLRRPFVEAAWKLVQNHDEVARYCCRAVGGEAAIVEGLLEPLDALLCSVAQMLFDEAPVEDLQSQMQKRVQVYGIPEKLRPRLASCLAYLRDRIGVPRDLPLPAAKMLRAYMAEAYTILRQPMR